jgi:Lipocalin-like domain
MKKITLLFLATILTFVISSCSKTEEVVPVTIVGKWNAYEIGATLDAKTYKTPPGKEVKEGTSTLTVDPFSYEFKADGTGIFGKETGKYTLSADKKSLAIILTSYTVNFEVSTLTGTELKLSSLKLTKKAGEKYKAVDIDGLFTSLNATYAIIGNGGTSTDITNSTSMQGTIALKK